MGSLAEAQLLLTPAKSPRLTWSAQYGAIEREGIKVSKCSAAVADQGDKALTVRVEVGVAVEVRQRSIPAAPLRHLQNSLACTGAV